MAELGIQVLSALAPLLVSGITSGFSWLGFKLAAWAAAKTGSENVKKALLQFNEVCTTVVQELAQTMVEAAKKRANGGPLTPADALAIRNEALGKIKAHFTVEALQDIAKTLGVADIDKFILSKIESAVLVLGAGVVQSPTTLESDKVLGPFYQSDAAHPAVKAGAPPPAQAQGVPGR